MMGSGLMTRRKVKVHIILLRGVNLLAHGKMTRNTVLENKLK